jgi:hypothetical protein
MKPSQTGENTQPTEGTDTGKQKRTRSANKVFEMPSVDFSGPVSESWNKVVDTSKAFLDALGEAKEVPVNYLRDVKQAVNYGMVQKIKAIKPTGNSPEAQMAKIKAQIAKAEAKLKELQTLGVE